MRTDLIVSTYNAPRALSLCLASIAMQVEPLNAVIIADDGSGPETKAVIDGFAADHPDQPVQHIWHEDRGFEKNAILNKAIEASSADYLIFTDGDCLLHPGFVARHVSRAEQGRFLCGSLIRMSQATSDAVTLSDVTSGEIFARGWLAGRGEATGLSAWLKTAPFPPAVMTALEVAWVARKSFIGSNSSAFRDSILAVNGFDETMKYGGEDKELGIRLANSGVTGRTLRYSAPVLHLEHPRGYADPAIEAANRNKLEASRRDRVTWTADGIRPGTAPA